jgi:predicted house-cleaning noncanonical NTP pyrophosphatase (MazG superfamily)
MKVFIFDKLVRDKVFENTLEDSKILHLEYRLLEGDELKRGLIAKIHEEADEIPIQAFADKEVKTEIADIQEALDALKKVYGLSDGDIAKVQQAKAIQKSSFEKAAYIESVELADDSEWIEHFREQPHKYKEYRETFEAPSIVKGIYEHYKGNKYEVMGIGCNSETHVWYVVYKPVNIKDGQPDIWVRPYEMFVGNVIINSVTIPRFKMLS